MLFKTEAVVLRRNKISEADVILTLFTRKYGKIRAVAKGGRKPKTKLSPASHLFVYGDFIINKGRNLDKISSVDINEAFYKIREDLTKLAYGSYILELCESVIVEGVTNNRLFIDLVNMLHVITNVDNGYNLIKIAFQLHVLKYSGFMPQIRECANCGAGPNNFTKLRFNIEQGGLICDKCSLKFSGGILIDITTLKAINYIANNDIRKILKLKLDAPIINRLEKILDKYIQTHLDKKSFKSLAFLNTLEKI